MSPQRGSRILRPFPLLTTFAALLTASTLATTVRATEQPNPAPMAFRPEIRLGNQTTGNQALDGYGFEPSIEVDRTGTIFVTAHKESPVNEGEKLGSWLWVSHDDGRTFQDLTAVIPDGAVGVNYALWGIEGDLALDSSDHLYFVDTWGPDSHMSRWSDNGRTWDYTRPFVLTAEPTDDRPWITAQGNDKVYYFASGANAVTKSIVGGRYIVHRSTDGGNTYDPVGIVLTDSEWCFPDADHNSSYVYALCGNGNGTLYSFVSADNGQSFARHVANTGVSDLPGSWPVMAVATDGSVWGLTRRNGTLELGRSTDHGTSWSWWPLSSTTTDISYQWLSVAPNGAVGVAWYGRGGNPSALTPWAGIVTWDRVTGEPKLVHGQVDATSVGPVPPPDFFQIDFGPDSAMHVSWTRTTGGSPLGGQTIRYSKQTAGPSLMPPTVTDCWSLAPPVGPPPPECGQT